MSVMTAQPPLPIAADPGATPLGDAAALVEDRDGGRVFLHGNLVYAWQTGEDALRRWSAVQLARLGAAPVAQIAAAFGVDPGTVWRWGQTLSSDGVAALASDKRGPRGPHRLTEQLAARIRRLREDGKSYEAIAAEVGVGATSVRRVLLTDAPSSAEPTTEPDPRTVERLPPCAAEPTSEDTAEPAAAPGEVAGEAASGPAPVLPVLPPAVDRSGERAAARFGQLSQAAPVFTPAARVPLAGLLLAMPALEATGLLACARRVFGALPNGFYGLDTVLIEAVLRTLAGQPRAEGATRIDPTALGRVLGLDRAPEVKTIRRKIAALAGTGHAGRLIAAMAATHLARTGTTTTTTTASTGTTTTTTSTDTSSDGSDGDGRDGEVGVVLYVDGHVRAYQGTRKLAKTHLARLRFPAPATVETWVSDAAGAPVLVVLAEPGASLAGELRRLLPQLRAAVGDDRRVLVGFDRGGWSPALFAHLHSHGFDVLTWRKGPTDDIEPDAFTDLAFTDDTGRTHRWRAADTTVTLPLTKPDKDAPEGGRDGEVFAMRQVTLAVPATRHASKQGRKDDAGASGVRQIHILTTRTDLPASEVIYRMGSRWRQENYFRYARMHFDLDSHDCYTATLDDPDRLVPNPAKKTTYQAVLAARTRHEQQAARTDAALLAARSPAPGTPTLLTNQQHDALTAGLREAETALTAAEATHQQTPARLPLKLVNPGQQVLDVETKLITHAIRIAAHNTATTLARELRVHTGYARANHEAHTLIRQALTGSGDIDPSIDGVLTIRLNPLPTRRATTAIAQLCEHLTATGTRYPGTDLILRYEIKTAP
jgi:Transposase protein/Homeodomain-like domain